MYRIKDTTNNWELNWNKPMTDELFVSIPLYTRPTEHDLGIAEAIGFDKGYKAGKKASER